MCRVTVAGETFGGKASEVTKILEEAFGVLKELLIKVKQTQGIPNGVTHGKKRPPTDECYSFFIWFSETEPKGVMEDIHHEIAEMIREDLWPSPLAYLNNDPDEDEVPEEDDDVELPPFWRQVEIVKFCQHNGIHVSAHTPLGVPASAPGSSDSSLGGEDEPVTPRISFRRSSYVAPEYANIGLLNEKAT